MGSSQSTDDGVASNHSTSPSSTTSLRRAPTSKHAHFLDPPHHHPSHSLSPPQPTKLPPTASTSVTHATAKAVQPGRPPPHYRSRSLTTGGGPILLPHDLLPSSQKSDSACAMGQADSRPQTSPQATPPKRSSTVPIPQPSKQERESEASPAEARSEESHAVDAPPPAYHDGSSEKDDEAVPPGYSESPYGLPPAAGGYIRPPRLPLPIEEEIHTPGSPIITPQDIAETTALESVDVEGGVIPRKSSVLSSTTIDEDDIGDNEAFVNDAQWGEIRVPTKLEWNGPGDKIFVTGTFCNWDRKVKLHRNKDKPGFSANINLQPGTHHIKFLVDGEMITSNDLPTTVDWTNILVNYIEIVAPMPASTEDAKQPPAPAEPMPIPGAAATIGQAAPTAEPAAWPLTDRTVARAPETDADLPKPPPIDQFGPKGERLGSLPEPSAPVAAPIPVQKPQLPKPDPKPTPAPPKHRLPRARYTNQIPQFLLDLDNYNNPEDERYQRAQRVASHLPSPPTLPMFLSKSILNGATPHKDDASVLIMPNHTVLNHLATSSIKHGVLATSGTTRYKRKFLTTIMYKPTSDDG